MNPLLLFVWPQCMSASFCTLHLSWCLFKFGFLTDLKNPVVCTLER